MQHSELASCWTLVWRIAWWKTIFYIHLGFTCLWNQLFVDRKIVLFVEGWSGLCGTESSATVMIPASFVGWGQIPGQGRHSKRDSRQCCSMQEFHFFQKWIWKRHRVLHDVHQCITTVTVVLSDGISSPGRLDPCGKVSEHQRAAVQPTIHARRKLAQDWYVSLYMYKGLFIASPAGGVYVPP